MVAHYDYKSKAERRIMYFWECFLRRVVVVLEAERQVVVVLVRVGALGHDPDVVAVRLVPGP